jgi:hypothetical protein
MNTGSFTESRLDGVAESRDGAAEDVEPGTEIADPAWRKGANARWSADLPRIHLGPVTHA